jgi:hypothetical protein
MLPQLRKTTILKPISFVNTALTVTDVELCGKLVLLRRLDISTRSSTPRSRARESALISCLRLSRRSHAAET